MSHSAEIERLKVHLWDAAAALLAVFRLPTTCKAWLDHLPMLQRDGSLSDDALDECDEGQTTHEASFAAGMTLCLPALSIMGLLYHLLK